IYSAYVAISVVSKTHICLTAVLNLRHVGLSDECLLTCMLKGGQKYMPAETCQQLAASICAVMF
ncbi:hypothetical protein DVA76_20030, partial [Acinetobacter baumannii]